MSSKATSLFDAFRENDAVQTGAATTAASKKTAKTPISHEGCKVSGENQMTSTQANDIARAFVSARRNGECLVGYPGPLPRSLYSGYDIQDRAIALDGRGVAGWKVGRIPHVFVGHAGANRLAGPILANPVQDVGSDPVLMPVYGGGFGAAEAEFLLRIGNPPDSKRTAHTAEQARLHIDAVHVGIEIASSPFIGINDLGPAVTVSDFGNNNGIVVGEAITDWRRIPFEHWSVELLIDGVSAGRGQSHSFPDGVFGSAAFLFNLLARRGYGLRTGQWISSGAITGVHPVHPGGRVEARFGEELRVSCNIVQAGPIL